MFYNVDSSNLKQVIVVDYGDACESIKIMKWKPKKKYLSFI